MKIKNPRLNGWEKSPFIKGAPLVGAFFL